MACCVGFSPNSNCILSSHFMSATQFLSQLLACPWFFLPLQPKMIVKVTMKDWWQKRSVQFPCSIHPWWYLYQAKLNDDVESIVSDIQVWYVPGKGLQWSKACIFVLFCSCSDRTAFQYWVLCSCASMGCKNCELLTVLNLCPLQTCSYSIMSMKCLFCLWISLKFQSVKASLQHLIHWRHQRRLQPWLASPPPQPSLIHLSDLPLDALALQLALRHSLPLKHKCRW